MSLWMNCINNLGNIKDLGRVVGGTDSIAEPWWHVCERNVWQTACGKDWVECDELCAKDVCLKMAPWPPQTQVSAAFLQVTKWHGGSIPSPCTSKLAAELILLRHQVFRLSLVLNWAPCVYKPFTVDYGESLGPFLCLRVAEFNPPHPI